MKKIINKVLSIFNLKLSLVSRQMRGPWFKDFGPYRINTCNEELLNSYRLYPETNQIIKRVVKCIHQRTSDFSMIDVGANCGDTVAIAKNGADIPILCVEADSKMVGVLHSNLEQFHNVTVVNEFLGERDESAKVGCEKVGQNLTLTATNGGAEALIQFRSLSTIAKEWSEFGKMKFLKVDAEGFDIRILIGATELIQLTKPVILFEYNREAMLNSGEDGLRIFELLRTLNYDVVMFYDAFGRYLLSCPLSASSIIEDLHRYADGKHGKVYYYDIIAFHRESVTLYEAFVANEINYFEKM